MNRQGEENGLIEKNPLEAESRLDRCGELRLASERRKMRRQWKLYFKLNG